MAIYCINLNKMSRISKSTEADSRLVGAQGCGNWDEWGLIANVYSTISFGSDEMFSNLVW